MGYNPQNYNTVASRLADAIAAIQTITTSEPIMLSDTMGYIRATVVLFDGCRADGTASFRLDLQGKSAQATNPIEDCETSAVGRALAFLGFSTTNGIASRNEIIEAVRRAQAVNAADAPPPITPERRALLDNLRAALDNKGADRPKLLQSQVAAMSDAQIQELIGSLS